MPPELLIRGLPPPDPRSLCPLSSTEFVEPPRTKFLGTPLIIIIIIYYLVYGLNVGKRNAANLAKG